MFRPMRRNKQQISMIDCVEILKNEPRGIMAIHGEDGYPYSFPMNHLYLNDKLYFHSATQGHKVDVWNTNDKVSFCVMDRGYREDGDWSLNIKSVIIFGKIKKLENQKEAVDIVRKLAYKNYPSEDGIEPMIAKYMGKFDVWELSIDHITGKLVNES